MDTIIYKITNFVTSQITGINGYEAMSFYEFGHFMTKYQQVEPLVEWALVWLVLAMLGVVAYLIVDKMSKA